MFRLLFPSVILKGRSLRQRWVRLRLASAALQGVDCEVKALRRNNNKHVNLKLFFMSSKSNKKRSYRDGFTGDRNEFIGSPVMSGGKADASGASTPSREKRINSEKKSKSPKGSVPVVIPETPVNSSAVEAVDWDAAVDQALTIGQPELVVPAEADNAHSLALVITRTLPVRPEHREEVAAFI
jgi:hypothetical protein